MVLNRRSLLFTAALAASVPFGGQGPAFADTSILNVSYDPTREFYKEFNAAFAAKWEADTGETVNIAVLAESSALYLDQVAGSSALQPHNWVGQHIPLHATSNGKVLLSGLDESALDAALGKLASYTPRTITGRAKFREELARVREQGYAVAVDELEVGLTAVAAPIRNAHGDVVASMSVSGPSFRLPEDRLTEVVRLVVSAAEEVSHRLGWGHR